MTASQSRGQVLAQIAASLIGTPFRLHGRSVELGLDCVGLVHVCLDHAGVTGSPPEGYQLRNSEPGRWLAFSRNYGLADWQGPVEQGDILVTSPGPGQQHVMILETPNCAIHAHAGLRRVVRQPIDLSSPPLAHWRLY